MGHVRARMLIALTLAMLSHPSPLVGADERDALRGLLDSGRYVEAIDEIETRLRDGDAGFATTCDLVDALTTAHAGSGDPFAARAALTAASGGAGPADARAGLALARLDLADRNPDAVLARVARLRPALGDDDTVGLARLALLEARSLALTGDPQAREAAVRAAAAAARIDGPERAQQLLAVAEALDASPPLRDAEALRRIAGSAAALPATGADGARALLARAIAYRLARQPGDAATLARRAQFAAQAARDAALEHRAATVLALAHRDRGDDDAAIAAFELALASFEGARVALVSEAMLDPTGVRHRVGRAFLGLADLLLARAALADAGTATGLRWRVIEAMERFKAAELQEFFLDPCAGSLTTVAPRQLAERLPADTALLYAVVLDDRVEWLVVREGAIAQATVADARAAERSARALRELLQDRGSTGIEAAGRILYDALLAPAAPLLAGAGHWLVVPDDWIRLIPLAAIHDGERYLIERVAVSGAPALTAALPLDEAQDTRPLLAGLTESVQGYAALPGVARELAALADVFGPGHPVTLRDQAFGPSTLERDLAAARPRVVHLATHGEIGRRVDQSFLLTWDDRITLDRLDRLLRESAGGPVDLLALSACQTASGDERAALGLGGVALQAGANRVLATLWYVSDAAAAELVPAFYRGVYERNLAPAVALREAQVALLRDKRYAHPAYWAPFMLIERIPEAASAAQAVGVAAPAAR